jgi:dTDP-4-dehydrorhamnose 3,5-epimerase
MNTASICFASCTKESSKFVKILPTEIPDVCVIEPRVIRDERGFFVESYNQRTLEGLGFKQQFVQDNHARSTKNVLRGLHYQVQQPQGKLIRVVQGRVFDVAVDLRKSSPTFGKAASTILDGESLKMFWVPAGCAHGYLVLSDTADLVYKVTDFYAAQHDRTLLWSDPVLGIQWPGDAADFILSEKDRKGVPLANAEVYA